MGDLYSPGVHPCRQWRFQRHGWLQILLRSCRRYCLSVGADLESGAVFSAYHYRLAGAATAFPEALVEMLVLFLAAYVGFVYFYRAGEMSFFRFPCCPQTVRQVPG